MGASYKLDWLLEQVISSVVQNERLIIKNLHRTG